MQIDLNTMIVVGSNLITLGALIGYFKAKVETRLDSIDKRLDKQNNRIEKCEDRFIEHIEEEKR